MQERKDVITMKGGPLTLLGPEIKVGMPAPDFTAVNNDLSPFDLSSLKGKTVVISAVPSLDTPVCDAQTRRFNQEAAALAEDIVIITISMDLPFAQARWCGATGIEKVKTVSDHRDASFANNWGMMIKELRLLARGVFVVDKEGIVQYVQMINELTQEPDYDAVLNFLK